MEQLQGDDPTLMTENPQMVSTGLALNGTPLRFRADIPPFRLVSVKFVAPYTRTTPQPAYLLDYSGNIAPNQMRINFTEDYMVGDVTKVYANEAAALVAAGIATYI